MEKKDKIYGGNYKVIQTKNGDMPVIGQSKTNLQALLDYANENNLTWVNLKIVENREKVEGKPTHSLVVDTWSPDPLKKKKVQEPTNDVPF